MSVRVRAKDIHKTYTIKRHRVQVLKGAGLSAAAGESVAVVGLSGAGKSTLLHVLGGLDRPEHGKVWIDDVDLYGVGNGTRAMIRARQLGFVFQSYHLLPEMDVLENVMLPAMALGGGRDHARNRARLLLEQVGLADRAHHTPLELSGGEQQRAALARALINDPQILLADEPTGNLDDETGGHVLDLLFGLTREYGHTLLMVTHSESTAASCDRVLRLHEGMLVPTGFAGLSERGQPAASKE